MNRTGALTLLELNRRIAGALSCPDLAEVWVTAEMSDARLSRGHCYMELIDKDADSGDVRARLKGVIWASTFQRINAEFYAATGQRLASGMKVLVRGSVNYHAAYGMSFVISAIDPSYTMGEVERRRREILERLQREGVADLNRTIEWPDVPWRIAVISAANAAGYGDFIHQLYHNPSRLRFRTRLFTAALQGQNTASSVIAALDAIAAEADNWDCVVIIRGGGATSDLVSFDDYHLAANVAQFPLPVVVGIGHERDVTVLDYVANMRVKTPTAAAEWLIARGEDALERLHRLASELLRSVADTTAEASRQLAYIESTLTSAPAASLQRAEARCRQAALTLAGSVGRSTSVHLARLDAALSALRVASSLAVERAQARLQRQADMLAALSPQATLARGYTITRTADGHAIRSSADLAEGTRIITTFADGSASSVIQSPKE